MSILMWSVLRVSFIGLWENALMVAKLQELLQDGDIRYAPCTWLRSIIVMTLVKLDRRGERWKYGRFGAASFAVRRQLICILSYGHHVAPSTSKIAGRFNREHKAKFSVMRISGGGVNGEYFFYLTYMSCLPTRLFELLVYMRSCFAPCSKIYHCRRESLNSIISLVHQGCQLNRRWQQNVTRTH